MQNGLQLNPEKSEALVIRTGNQLHAMSSVTSVAVAGVNLPVADETKVLSVAQIGNRLLTSTCWPWHDHVATMCGHSITYAIC